MNRRFRRLFIVFPFPPNIAFQEILVAYRHSLSKMDWISVECLSLWSPERSDWYDPRNAIVFWCHLPDSVPEKRRARCAFYYLESSAPSEDLVYCQKSLLEKYLPRVREPDILFVQTPSVERFWIPRARQVAVVPMGYDPQVMGVPDWSRPKKYDVGYCGVFVGRRKWILPLLKKRLGGRFRIVRGYGQLAKEGFEDCRTMLYIAHSDEPGFATLRIWQAISTSAALVAEKRDTWPAIPGRHLLEIPPAEKENPEPFLDGIEEALRMPLAEVAQRAHQELSKYTVEKCVLDYMVPAIERT